MLGVGEIEHRRLVGSSGVGKAQGVGAGEGVHHLPVERTGVAFIAILAPVGQGSSFLRVGRRITARQGQEQDGAGTSQAR